MFRVRNTIMLFVSVLLASTSMADVIDGEALVDPTRPFQVTAVDNGNLIVDLVRTDVLSNYDLSFVRAGGDHPIAVINQQQLTIGDVIGDAEVIVIDRGGVTLSVNDEEHRVSLYGVSVKSNAKSQ